MSLRKISSRALLFSAVLLTFVPLLPAEAQDVNVPNNITIHDSTDPTVGNILKEGVPFIHNFGVDNTFIGKNAGNLSMNGQENTACGAFAGAPITKLRSHQGRIDREAMAIGNIRGIIRLSRQ
jgi:hypothetical protein